MQISAPSNLIGNVYGKVALKALINYCDNYGIYFISDEISHGLLYGKKRYALIIF
ncbi:MAG: hypothetical protein DRR08_23300 [Candidatus Parabeggiatoa sp. nov. 2]|nr:MAG: hypothetical protein DRR08_23300 [Gammaproteobacteria bacterium]